MGKREEFESPGEDFKPDQGAVTDPATGVSQNGNVHTAAADDEREKGE